MMDEGKSARIRQIGKLMPWKCACNASNEDYAAFCSTCCRPNEFAVVPPSAATPTQPAKASTGIAAWQLMAVAGVLILGMVFGLSFAVTAFSTGEARQTAETHSNAETKSAFQEAFDASFKKSCQQSAMRSGNVSQSRADRYCECALSVFHETHSMTQAATTCSQRVRR